jgi:hypothetical protein
MAPLPPEERRLISRTARLSLLLLVSPLLLIGARLFAAAATADILAADHGAWLAIWGIGVFGLAILQLKKLFKRAPAWTNFVLALVLAQTVAVAVLYDYAAITSRRSAVPGTPERTYEIVRHRNRLPDYVVHQRADGSTVEGEDIGAAVPYGTACVEVQRLQGHYGFAWVKVVGRSPPPEHEVAWPIRREDCFSDKPLATLKG